MVATKTMVIVPFYLINGPVIFRYGKKWWHKQHGTINYIESTNPNENLRMPIHSYDVVATWKSNIPKHKHHEIKREFLISVI